MENFFKPVHSPSDPDKIKLRKHHHHHHHHHQDHQSHRYTGFDDTDRNTDESHGHPHYDQHGHYHHDKIHHNAHHQHQFHHSEEDEILYNNTHAPVTFSKASSSSLSSSSSSSSSSTWYTESSANDPFSLRHAERPQHSLSCSNIPDVRRCFRLEDNTDPVVFATIKHGSSGSICSDLIGSLKKERHVLSSLDRGHSRSDEGLLQGSETGLRGQTSRATVVNYGPLNKTTSLNRSLAFSEEDILLGVSKGPKRAVSSSQLPSKGILKNKEPHLDIRKAKSMEVLSPRVAAGQNPTGQKGKEITQAEIVQARENFVQGKLKFSAFLDEITKQVMSPSHLNILGVNNNNKGTGMTSAPAQTPEPVKPQLPPKKHRGNSGEERAQHLKHHGKHEKATRSSSRKHSDCSNPDKLISYAVRNHQGSPPPHHSSHTSIHSTHHGSSRKDRRPSPTGDSMSEDRCGRCGPYLTDGTSTSPEPTPPKQRNHRKQQPTASHTQHYPQQGNPTSGPRGAGNSPPSSAQGAGAGLGFESSSSKSDSSRTRDTVSSATSPSSEQSGRYLSHHVGHSEQHRGTLCDNDHLQALQEENADLHQNLLQTVVCIESLEVELQRTRDELSHVKEKYKSLLETHSGTKQANNLLGEHLHIASESLSSERKYMLNRVAQLSSELEYAHRTIAALENINVPCLIKELLEKHCDSTEAIQQFVTTSTPLSHSATSSKTDNQLHTPKVEEASRDWLSKSEAGVEQVTAFTPFKQEVPATEIESHISGPRDSTRSPPFSVADISTAIYKKMAASYAARPQPLYPPGQQQPSLGINPADPPPSNLQQAHEGADSWGRKGGVDAVLLEQDIVDVTSMSAQQILNDFMQQLQTHKEAGGETQPQGGQEWVGGAEQTGRVAD